MSFRFLSHIIKTKGLIHSVERSAQVFYRFSFGKKAFADMMSSLERHFGPGGMRVTFCITACLIEDHLSFLERFKDRGHEFAAHGFFHTNMQKKSYKEQIEIIERSYSAFERLKMPVYGFRCPYLSYNDSTLEALSSSRFAWTSNDIIFWDGLSRVSRGQLKRLGSIYRTVDSEVSISKPRHIGRIVGIPITAPDDEMLIERLRVKDCASVSDTWKRIFGKVYSRGELFHLLFHPERFNQIRTPMKEVTDMARGLSPRVWFPTINEITDWWTRRKAARWSIENADSRYRLTLKGPEGSRVLVKTDRRVSGLICGLYANAPFEKKDDEFILETNSPWRHVIEISERCSPAVEEFLAEEGFITIRVERPHRDSLFLEGYESLRESDKRALLEAVERSDRPLYRLWRWPNGAQAAFTISSDVDSIDLPDFFRRFLYF